MMLALVSKYGVNILLDFKPEEAPVGPEVAEILKRRVDGGPDVDPLVRCLPAGIPLSTLLSEVTKIVPTPGLMARRVFAAIRSASRARELDNERPS